MRMSLTKVLAAVVLAVIVILVVVQFGPSVLSGEAPAVSTALRTFELFHDKATPSASEINL